MGTSCVHMQNLTLACAAHHRPILFCRSQDLIHTTVSWSLAQGLAQGGTTERARQGQEGLKDDRGVSLSLSLSHRAVLAGLAAPLARQQG